AGARRSARTAWSTRRRARPAPRGSARLGTRRTGRRGRRYDRCGGSARAAAHDPDATVMSPSARRADVVSQDAVLFSFLFGPLRRQSTPNTDEIKECGESTYENHEHRKNNLLDPP